MMVETSLSTENKKYDFVRISYMLASYVPIPFWIVVYNLDLLPVLFPSYKGKDMANAVFFAPAFIAIFAASIMYICRYVILKIEKNRFTLTNRLVELPLNDLLFEYFKKESYGKLFLVVLCWAAEFVQITATTTVIFGLFIVFKYLRT